MSASGKCGSQPVRNAARAAAPGVDLVTGPELPADLQARTLARIEQAARKSRWRRGNVRTLAAPCSSTVMPPKPSPADD
jgi:hypothetical protein